MRDFYKGSTRWEKSCPRQKRDRGCRVPFSSLRDPVLAGSRLPEPETVLGKPLVRLAAQRRPPSASLQALHLLRRPGLSKPGNRRKLWRWFPLSGGWKTHGECLRVSPEAAGRGKGGGNELHRPRELSGFPFWGRPLRYKGNQGGTLGTFPGIHSPREGHPVSIHWLL